MSIESHIKAAQVLIGANMPHEALSNIMIAIAGSSKKLYPQGTLSLIRPTKPMLDRESFTLFLGKRLARILSSNYIATQSGISVSINGEQKLIEDILYKNYRCALIHEAELPIDIEFVETKREGASISVVGENKIILDHGWLPILISVVTHAPTNYDIFENGFKRFGTNKSIDEQLQFEGHIMQKHNISKGRFEILKEICAALGIEKIIVSSDLNLKILFYSDFVLKSQILGFSGGVFTGLFTAELIDYNNQLTDSGALVLLEMAEFYA